MRGTSTIASGLLLVVATVLAPVAMTPAAAVGETCDGKAATIVVPDAPNAYRTVPVTGTPGDDVIVGTDQPDTIDGAGGNDTICGQAGDDKLVGGAGDDRLFGGLDGEYQAGEGYWGDMIEPGPGNDYVDLGHDPQSEHVWELDLSFWDRVSYRHAPGPVTVDLAAGTATGDGTDVIAPIVFAGGIDGSAHADLLLGSDKDDLITAGGGHDTVDSRGGDDYVNPDTLWGGGEGSGPGDDVVEGGPGNDEIRAGQGADEVSAGSGSDQVTVEAATGALVLGGAGRDAIAVSGRAKVDGGSGADTLRAELLTTADRVRLAGGPGRDELDLVVSKRVAPDGSRLVIGNPAGTVRVPGQPVMVRYTSLHGFRPLGLRETLRVTWYGTPRADVLDWEMYLSPVRAFGRGGNDRLRGGARRDLLDGGPGRDVLDGQQARDVCVRGEEIHNCEARR